MPPARQQIDREALEEYLKERRPEGGTYNIWHHRIKTIDRDWSRKGLPAKYKLDVKRDSGETSGSSNPNAYFCLFFAKGMCAQGAQCPMWHRIPNESDEVETTIDCFGRDKYMEFRQDMGGVGAFNTQNKTLYVGRIAPTENMYEIVRKHFGAFGAIDRLRIIKHRGVAFVTYRSRSNAEFAREAMMNQALGNNEILNVRWATAEQDAQARGGAGRSNQAAGGAAYNPPQAYAQQDAESELPAEFAHVKREVAEDTFHDLEDRAKRQRLEEAQAQPQYYYDTESARAIYGYTAPAISGSALSAASAHEEQQQPAKKVAGIIPQNVLDNLKTLSKADEQGSTTAEAPKSGLGSLAGYGSDSDEDDDA